MWHKGVKGCWAEVTLAIDVMQWDAHSQFFCICSGFIRFLKMASVGMVILLSHIRNRVPRKDNNLVTRQEVCETFTYNIWLG